MTNENHAEIFQTPKNFPLNETALREVIKKFPTPFHIYDEKNIRENSRLKRRPIPISSKF